MECGVTSDNIKYFPISPVAGVRSQTSYILLSASVNRTHVMTSVEATVPFCMDVAVILCWEGMISWYCVLRGPHIWYPTSLPTIIILKTGLSPVRNVTQVFQDVSTKFNTLYWTNQRKELDFIWKERKVISVSFLRRTNLMEVLNPI